MNEDQNVPQKINDKQRASETLDFRVKSLEHHNQLRKISSKDGKTYFNTETGEIVIEDTDTLRKTLITNGLVIFYDENGDEIGRIFGDYAEGHGIMVSGNIEMSDGFTSNGQGAIRGPFQVGILGTPGEIDLNSTSGPAVIKETGGNGIRLDAGEGYVKGAHKSSDGTEGWSGEFAFPNGVGITAVTVKNGIVTAVVDS